MDSRRTNLAKQPEQFTPSATNTAKVAHDKMLDDIINEVGCLLAKQHDQQRVSNVLSTIAGEFSNARITSYLPVLIFKKASELLAASSVAPPAVTAPANAATLAKLDFLRFEFKYILREDVCGRIEKELSHFMTPDPFVASQENHNYIVRSLYYDDPAFSSYHQKADGMLLRSKFRLRTYTNNPKASCATYLEIKGRYNSLVFKHRAGFNSADGSKAFVNCASTTNEIINSIKDSSVAEKFLFELARRKIEPIMLIDYNRRPYVSKNDPDFRLTLDDRLHGTMTNQLFPSHLQTRRQLLPGYTVMEIKFKNSIPLWFHRIIQNYGLERTPISKVCKGIEAWNLVPLLD